MYVYECMCMCMCMCVCMRMYVYVSVMIQDVVHPSYPKIALGEGMCVCAYVYVCECMCMCVNVCVCECDDPRWCACILLKDRIKGRYLCVYAWVFYTCVCVKCMCM